MKEKFPCIMVLCFIFILGASYVCDADDEWKVYRKHYRSYETQPHGYVGSDARSSDPYRKSGDSGGIYMRHNFDNGRPYHNPGGSRDGFYRHYRSHETQPHGYVGPSKK